MGFFLPASRLLLTALALCFLSVSATSAADPTPASTPQGGKLEQELVYKATVGTSGEVRELLERGAQPDKAYNTENVPALSLSAQRKDIEAISVLGALINGGANINIRDGYGQSPLFYAAKAGVVDNVRYLLQRGAVYYQTDLKGNIARSVAHAEGYDEVVKVMDEFVAAQTKSVMDAYAARDRKIEEQYKKLSEEQAAALAEAHKREETLSHALHTEDAEKRAGSDALDEAAFRQLVYGLSYHSCASAYWEFCRSNRIGSSLGHEGIKTQLEAHELLKKTAADSLKSEFGANKAYLKRITEPSQSKLLGQFKNYPTNAHLRSAGVGEKQDMDERCGFIAESWDVLPKKRRAAEKATGE